MKTTLNDIKSYGPCSQGWRKLLRNLGKTCSDNEPLKITTILDSNGLDDAMWCLRAVDLRGLASALNHIDDMFHRDNTRIVQADLLRFICAEIEQRP